MEERRKALPAAGWRGGRWLIRFPGSRYGIENTRRPNPTRSDAGGTGSDAGRPDRTRSAKR